MSGLEPPLPLGRRFPAALAAVRVPTIGEPARHAGQTASQSVPPDFRSRRCGNWRHAGAAVVVAEIAVKALRAMEGILSILRSSPFLSKARQRPTLPPPSALGGARRHVLAGCNPAGADFTAASHPGQSGARGWPRRLPRFAVPSPPLQRRQWRSLSWPNEVPRAAKKCQRRTRSPAHSLDAGRPKSGTAGQARPGSANVHANRSQPIASSTQPAARHVASAPPSGSGIVNTHLRGCPRGHEGDHTGCGVRRPVPTDVSTTLHPQRWIRICIMRLAAHHPSFLRRS